MAVHNDLGKEGEEEAVSYLKDRGYIIQARNWRSGKRELDIVAIKNNLLVIIEVKTRRDNRFGDPEEAVTDKKIRNIVASTDMYIKKFAIDLPVRFDVITVIGKEKPFEIEHITEAFFPPIW